jgi:hypothetical protein
MYAINIRRIRLGVCNGQLKICESFDWLSKTGDGKFLLQQSHLSPVQSVVDDSAESISHAGQNSAQKLCCNGLLSIAIH